MSERIVLEDGDMLVLYTDGPPDARAPFEVLDDRELAEMPKRGSNLSGEELAAFLEASVTRGEDPRDDIALLLVERVRAGG